MVLLGTLPLLSFAQDPEASGFDEFQKREREKTSLLVIVELPPVEKKSPPKNPKAPKPAVLDLDRTFTLGGSPVDIYYDLAWTGHEGSSQITKYRDQVPRYKRGGPEMGIVLGEKSDASKLTASYRPIELGNSWFKSAGYGWQVSAEHPIADALTLTWALDAVLAYPQELRDLDTDGGSKLSKDEMENPFLSSRMGLVIKKPRGKIPYSVQTEIGVSELTDKQLSDPSATTVEIGNTPIAIGGFLVLRARY